VVAEQPRKLEQDNSDLEAYMSEQLTLSIKWEIRENLYLSEHDFGCFGTGDGVIVLFQVEEIHE
jgi:hypothetical protein